MYLPGCPVLCRSLPKAKGCVKRYPDTMGPPGGAGLTHQPHPRDTGGGWVVALPLRRPSVQYKEKLVARRRLPWWALAGDFISRSVRQYLFDFKPIQCHTLVRNVEIFPTQQFSSEDLCRYRFPFFLKSRTDHRSKHRGT